PWVSCLGEDNVDRAAAAGPAGPAVAASLAGRLTPVDSGPRAAEMGAAVARRLAAGVVHGGRALPAAAGRPRHADARAAAAGPVERSVPGREAGGDAWP